MASNDSELDPAFVDNMRSRITVYEGRESHVYPDTKGHPTVGIGFNLDRSDAATELLAVGANYADVRAGRADLTDTQINALFASDLKSAMSSARELVSNFDSLSDARKFVVTDMTFNMGQEGFSEFHGTIAAIERGDFAAAADHMQQSDWYGQVGNRSVANCAMMRSGDWTQTNERGDTGRPGASAVLEYGSRGPGVEAIQRELGVRADGDFGQKTEEAVREFQKSHGLTADGVVGAQTRAALDKSRANEPQTPNASHSPGTHVNGVQAAVQEFDKAVNAVEKFVTDAEKTLLNDVNGVRPPTPFAPQSGPAPQGAGAPTKSDQELVNSRIAEVADKLYGMSTHYAQTHDRNLDNGNLACAYSVNQVLESALGRTYGANPEAVPSVMADLERHGKEVPAADVRPGDIAIKLPSAGETHGHIGIVTQGGPDPIILNNSSSHGSFTNQNTPAQFSYNYVTHREQDQVVYLRIDPNSVDLAKLRETPIPEKLLGPDNAPPNASLTTRGGPPEAPQPPQKVELPAWHVSGETRDGVLVESKSVLAHKNALLQVAIEGAKNGHTPAFAFTASPGESKQTVEMQNQFLDRAVAMHLPPAERAAFCKEKGIDLGPEISGQKGADGKPVESPAELEAKNAKLQKAIVLAQHGIVDTHPFRGDGKESPETVKAQNELLQAAIRDNLPAGQARDANAQEPTTRKEQLDSAIEKFNMENPNRQLPAAREASDWDKSRPLAGTMLELGKDEYAVNLGRGSYAYVESNQLSSAPPAPNTYVELGRDGSVNGEREIAMTQSGR
jgi:peptidoglycan hydrolase-like protein with peptidoglycan-binding domain/GH24 family phage-related lysozyme (muramidase)